MTVRQICVGEIRLSRYYHIPNHSMLTHKVLHVVWCHTPPVTPVTRDTPAIASRVARDRHTAPRDRPCMRIAHHPPTQPTMHRYKNTHMGMRSSRVRPWSTHGDRRSHASDIWDIVARRRCVFSPVSAAAVVSCLILARVDRRTRATTTTTRRGGIRARRVGDIFRGASSGDVRWRGRARGWTRARPPMVARGRIRGRGAFA